MREQREKAYFLWLCGEVGERQEQVLTWNVDVFGWTAVTPEELGRKGVIGLADCVAGRGEQRECLSGAGQWLYISCRGYADEMQREIQRPKSSAKSALLAHVI